MRRKPARAGLVRSRSFSRASAIVDPRSDPYGIVARKIHGERESLQTPVDVMRVEPPAPSGAVQSGGGSPDSAIAELMPDADRAGQPCRLIAGAAPMLDASTRQRLGHHLQALYEPVIDEGLDPRLAALIRQLDDDRQAGD